MTHSNEEPNNPVLKVILENRSGKGKRPRPDLSSTIAEAQALLQEGDQAHDGIPDDARNLLLGQIEPDPLQPRRHFETEELRSLAEDIERRGVLLPILVRPAQVQGGKYRIISGERRWRACLLIGKTRIPARIRVMSDEEVQEAQLAENVQRKDLSDIEKGRALRRLYEIRKSRNAKATWEDVAAEVGLGRARIHDLYHLASLPDSIAALIRSGRLSGSHGTVLYRAQEALDETILSQLAEAAARPNSRRNGGFQMSVARLRQSIQERLPQAEAPAVETAPVKSPSRPSAAANTSQHLLEQVSRALQQNRVLFRATTEAFGYASEHRWRGRQRQFP